MDKVVDLQAPFDQGLLCHQMMLDIVRHQEEGCVSIKWISEWQALLHHDVPCAGTEAEPGRV